MGSGEGHTMRTPTIGLYKRLLESRSQKCKLLSYQASVLIITYITYMLYHAAKRPISVVKGELNPNCTISKINNTCTAWEPFDSPKHSKDLFGLLDCAFLLTYALAMFVSGYIAEKTNLRIYLSCGMVLTGILTCLFGMSYYWKVHSHYYFFLVQILTGITQSSGWPCVVESVGVWFPAGRRGLIMGIWNTHTSVGNILGSAVAGLFVEQQWGLSFIVPGVMIGGFGIFVFLFLLPDPKHVGMDRLISPQQDHLEESLESQKSNRDEPIEIWTALKIPGVIEYSLCLFFAKLVSYTFLFWLPFYIGKITIGGKVYSQEESADWAILFDVGGALGGITAGALNDWTQKPGLVNLAFLLLAAPCLFLLRFHGSSNVTSFIVWLALSGLFVNGPYALITTAVSASLGSHPCLMGNSKAMAVVTAIIDATGSLGAALGPLLAGVISSHFSWNAVFYMLIGADLLGVVFLMRRVFFEFSIVCGSLRGYACSINTTDADQNSVDVRTPLLNADA